MVEDKGTLVLIDAAKRLESEYKERVQFLLCGGLDTNPNGITKQMLESRCDGSYIQWLGHRKDVLELLRQSHIMAFPSWYREGLPKSVIEAEAIGRPVVTTDSVGCRDTVVDGHNGFMIPIKDSEALAAALKKLIDDPQLRQTMGKNAREFAVSKFDIEEVVKVHLDLYQSITE
jgi:glycosyltransferase involved in cell wall biosynthesis